MKRYISGAIYTVRKDLLLVLLGGIIGLAALWAVHLLPLEPMREHVYWSLPMIEKEFNDELVLEGYSATLTGNFTDCLMLEHAVYRAESHSLLEQVLCMYRGESCELEDAWYPGHSLKDYLENIPQPREVEYARYWHGYLVILKPLLLLTSFNTIRLINSAVQLLLAGCVVMGFCRKNAVPLAMGFLLSLPFIYFVSTYASLSLSICYYIMALSLLVQARFDALFFRRNLYGEFFLVVGMAASYFDFLTYPLVTLVFPLCVYLYFHGGLMGDSLRKMCRFSFQWFGGYMGLWALKWVLVELLTDKSAIRDALDTLITRTGSAQGYSAAAGFWSVLQKNIQPYCNWCYVILAGTALVLMLFQVKKGWCGWNKVKRMIPYAILALYPLIWFMATQNHSEQHWQYTCRILACSVFAIYAGYGKIWEREQEKSG